ERFGADLIAELRAALLAVIGKPAQNLPLYLPMVLYFDGMRTSFVSPTDEQLSMAVGSEAELGLSALLSRALLLFTLDYERESALSLPMSADILPAIGTDRVRLRDLPLRAGVSKEAVSAAVGFLERNGFAVTGPDETRGRAVALADRGIAAFDAHEGLLGAAEERWAERCGAATIGRLRTCVDRFAEHRQSENEAGEGQFMLGRFTLGQFTLSLGLRPHPDGWRAQRRYKAHTDGILADPWTALPAHPMVLHRGGYPDGY
ncbi:MAG: hypothetical protein LBV34_18595, partial [Nocardiopsaceae bacterium]|nr:hypothetical protein [Nocardiopsaceae bacterium]